MTDDIDIVMETVPQTDGVNIDAQRLFDLAAEKTDESYAKLTQEIVSIYSNKALSDIEYKIANDILLTLLQQAEIDLREALAERLAVQDNVPQELIVRLAHDDIAVASHIILNSIKLSDMDLMTLIRERGAKHWQTIAQRQNITTAISTGLIKTNDIETSLHLIQNASAALSDENMTDLSRMALRSEKLHVPLLNRPEVNNDIALNLYMYVSQSLRRKILDTYNINKEQLDRTLESLLTELHAACYDEWDVTEEMQALAKSFWERQEISSGLLIRTLRRGQIAFFAALMSVWLDMDIDKMRSILQGDNGKSFAVACRSLGIIKSEFATIFLLSSALHSETKTVDQNNLLKVLQFFDKITTPDAQKVIRSWAKKPEQSARENDES